MPNFAKPARSTGGATLGKSVFFFFLFGLLLPTQLGKHFWPASSLVNGMRVDYLAPTLYLTYLLLVIVVMFTTRRYYRWLALLAAVLAVGLFPFSALTLYRYGQYLAIGTTALMVVSATKQERSYLLYGLAASALYQLVLVALQLHTQHAQQGLWWLLGERRYSASTPGVARISLQGQLLMRPYGTFSHPNSMGGFYGLVALLLWYEKRPLWAVGSILLVLLSFSRLAAVSLALGLIFILWQTKHTCLLCRIAKTGMALLAAAVPFVPLGSATSWQDRILTFRAGFTSLVQHWWQPPALGQYLYQDHPLPSTLFHQPIHNIFLIFLVEWRLIGIACLAALSWFAFKKIPIALLLSVLLLGFFDHYQLTLVQNMLLLGIIIGWGKRKKTSGQTSRAG